jgi:hypothetical protein
VATLDGSRTRTLEVRGRADPVTVDSLTCRDECASVDLNGPLDGSINLSDDHPMTRHRLLFMFNSDAAVAGHIVDR